VGVGMLRLLGINDREAVLIGQEVHARAHCELVDRLLATVQHDDERHRPAHSRRWNVQTVRQMIDELARQRWCRMIRTRPIALRPGAGTWAHTRFAGFTRASHHPFRRASHSIGGCGTLSLLGLRGLAQVPGWGGRHARHQALEALKPEFRQTFGHWTWLAKKGLIGAATPVYDAMHNIPFSRTRAGRRSVSRNSRPGARSHTERPRSAPALVILSIPLGVSSFHTARALSR
jgi:hypothetical protein